MSRGTHAGLHESSLSRHRQWARTRLPRWVRRAFVWTHDALLHASGRRNAGKAAR